MDVAVKTSKSDKMSIAGFLSEAAKMKMVRSHFRLSFFMWSDESELISDAAFLPPSLVIPTLFPYTVYALWAAPSILSLSLRLVGERSLSGAMFSFNVQILPL